MKTKEEIIKYKCKECGKDVLEKDLHYMDNDRLVKEELCFSCDFWMEKVKTIEDSNWARIDNQSYYVGEENKGGFRGFDGQKFKIKFNARKKVWSWFSWCIKRRITILWGMSLNGRARNKGTPL